jgi:imidazolonepropionase-like amidohydrolase
MWLRAAMLVDGTGARPVRDGVVQVEGERIVRVGRASQFALPAQDVLDLGDACLLPGLIDMHGHLRLSHLEADTSRQMRDPTPLYLERACENLLVNLRSGVTTMRCHGDRDFLDVHLRQRIADQDVRGPRLLVATRGIKSPGCSGGLVATVIVDGREAIDEAVRHNARRGADHIKIFASDGLGPRATATRAAWTADEARAAVEAAHAEGLPIAAHCHGGPLARPLIEAGVDSIEHGSFLTDNELDAMAARGTHLDMTLGVLLDPRSSLRQRLRVTLGGDGLRRLVDEVLERMRRALDLGVTVTLGTDTMHGLLGVEAAALASLGVWPVEVIATMTSRAARVLRRADQFGTLKAGLIADVIAVAGDPLRDIDALGKPVFVMARGRQITL